ncbi:MAG: hypothetical protein AAGI88_23405, partial [Pseudomonadota bacterium]
IAVTDGISKVFVASATEQAFIDAGAARTTVAGVTYYIASRQVSVNLQTFVVAGYNSAGTQVAILGNRTANVLSGGAVVADTKGVGIISSPEGRLYGVFELVASGTDSIAYELAQQTPSPTPGWQARLINGSTATISAVLELQPGTLKILGLSYFQARLSSNQQVNTVRAQGIDIVSKDVLFSGLSSFAPLDENLQNFDSELLAGIPNGSHFGYRVRLLPDLSDVVSVEVLDRELLNAPPVDLNRTSTTQKIIRALGEQAP